MLASTPSPHYLPQFPRDSPSYRSPFAVASTPPGFKSESTSPFHSPMPTPSPLRARNTMDPEDPFFHSPSTSRIAVRRSPHREFHRSSTPPPFVPPTTLLPLRTPVKDSRKKLFLSSVNEGPDSLIGIGAKRKPAPLSFNAATPLRKRTTTPLKMAATAQVQSRVSTGSFAFERLAPLTEPRFACTPQTKAETDLALRRQAETMKKLKICDLDLSGDESDTDNPPLFLTREDEVATNISLGGRITKRRVRSRPISNELLEDAADSPFLVKTVIPDKKAKRPTVGPIIFPTLTPFRTRRGSGSSSDSDCPSPIPPHRAQAGAGPRNRTHSQSAARLPFNRHASNSSASLFFGPSIPDIKENTRSTVTLRPDADACHTRSKVASRHSYAGTTESRIHGNATISCSPPLSYREGTEGDDLFGPLDTSFAFTLTEGTPSSRSRNNTGQMLPKKYKPRDSGVSFEDDSNKLRNDYMPGMPTASTSVSTIYSGDEALVTPISGPGNASGWPIFDHVVVVDADQDASMQLSASTSGSSLQTGTDPEGFIMRLLVGGAQSSHPDNHCSKKMPGTPVKKMKTANFAVNRPWQSAFTSKIGSEEFDYLAPPRTHIEKGGNGKRPRKSLPAAFPMLMAGGGDCDSPTERRDNKYAGIGLGRPSDNSKAVKSVAGRAHWLMRRSSSGAFSSGSETSGTFPTLGTPTRFKDRDWKLPPPRIPAQLSPSITVERVQRLSSDQRSFSPHRSLVNVNPTTTLGYPPSANRSANPRYSNSSEECLGKFEREFTVINGDLGSGQFGRVMKVRRIVDDDEELVSLKSEDENVFAVKKSKPMEGVKHRLRLREEVDILRHLTQAATAPSLGGRGHPNVLSYVDSWEQDGVLYIQTELCELGSLERFLWEYGRAFPRLNEARVWKILSDLSNGMLFIHDNGIIHLDLKPANIFITGEGRFKIGDFGMASVWPRLTGGGFEREGDKEYMAPEVLQGRYGKAADIFGLGMTMLETATNIVVPGQGAAWHRLRQENFEQVDMSDSPELFDLIKSMMRTNAALRVDIHTIWSHTVVCRTRGAMERIGASSRDVFGGSPLASVPDTFLREVLDRPSDDGEAMDLSP